jgi:hypothetical protein
VRTTESARKLKVLKNYRWQCTYLISFAWSLRKIYNFHFLRKPLEHSSIDWKQLHLSNQSRCYRRKSSPPLRPYRIPRRMAGYLRCKFSFGFCLAKSFAQGSRIKNKRFQLLERSYRKIPSNWIELCTWWGKSRDLRSCRALLTLISLCH